MDDAVGGQGPGDGPGAAGRVSGGDHDGDHARADVRADHGPDLAHDDVAVAEVAGEPGAQPVGERARAVLPARWATATSTWRSSAAATASSSSRPRRAPRCGPSPGGDPAVDEGQQRLHRERRPEHRGGGADAAAATEVLQGVDVEQRRGRPGAGERGALGLLGRPPASRTSAAVSTANPVAIPSWSVSTVSTGSGRLAGGELGGLEGAAHLARQVDREHRLGAGGVRASVGVEEHRRRRARGADRVQSRSAAAIVSGVASGSTPSS